MLFLRSKESPANPFGRLLGHAGYRFPHPALSLRRLPRAFLWISPLHRSEKTTRRTVSPTPTGRKGYLPVSPWAAEPYRHPRNRSVQGKRRSQAGSDLNIPNLDSKSFLLVGRFFILYLVFFALSRVHPQPSTRRTDRRNTAITSGPTTRQKPSIKILLDLLNSFISVV